MLVEVLLSVEKMSKSKSAESEAKLLRLEECGRWPNNDSYKRGFVIDNIN